MKNIALLLIGGLFVFGIFTVNQQEAFSELFSGMEIYTETFGLPETFLRTDEIFMLFDTTNIANMSKVTVTANLPCSSSDEPRFKVAVGTLSNSTNIIDSSVQSLNYAGPGGSCTYSGTVKAADENITIQRVWLTPNNGTHNAHTFFGNLVTLTALLDDGNAASVPTSSADFEDNFDTDDWIDQDSAKNGVNTSTQQIDINLISDSSNDSMHYALTDVSDSQWIVQIKNINFDTLVQGGDNAFWIGLDSLPSANARIGTHDFIGISLDNRVGNEKLRLHDYDGASLGTTGETNFNNVWAVDTQYCLEFGRDSTTAYHATLYSDSNCSVQINTMSGTVASTVVNTDYLVIRNVDASTVTGSFVGELDNISFWNGISSVP